MKRADINTKAPQIVLDPSMLMPPSNMLLCHIMQRGIGIALTKRMLNLIWPGPSSTVDNELFALLRLWGGRAEHIGLSVSWIRRNLQPAPNMNPQRLNPNLIRIR
jgi:hypothetical protein